MTNAQEYLDYRRAFRLANETDAPGICVLLRESITELCTADHEGREIALREWLANKTCQNVAAWIRSPENVMAVIIIKLAIASVGCLRTDGEITLNYVAPTFRFRGLSKAMLGELERRASTLGIKSIRLQSTQTAHRFYLAAGFVDEPATNQKHGLATYPMAKLISSPTAVIPRRSP